MPDYAASRAPRSAHPSRAVPANSIPTFRAWSPGSERGCRVHGVLPVRRSAAPPRVRSDRAWPWRGEPESLRPIPDCGVSVKTTAFSCWALTFTWLHEAGDGGTNPVPALAFIDELLFAPRGEFVIFRALIVLRSTPFRFDPNFLLQPMQCRV